MTSEIIMTRVLGSSSNVRTMDLAAKYNVPFTDGVTYPGCPCITDPLATQGVKLRWADIVSATQTNKMLFEQFSSALQIVDALKNHLSKEALEYLQTLNIYGLVMCCNILKTNGLELGDILSGASVVLDMHQVPYGIGSTLDIFNAYIGPMIASSLVTETAEAGYTQFAQLLASRGSTLGKLESTVRLLTGDQRETLIDAFVSDAWIREDFGLADPITHDLITKIIGLRAYDPNWHYDES